MKSFNKDLFIKNIYYLVKDKGTRIGELEETIGVSIGYFSRLKDSASGNPSVDIVCALSEYFNVSIDRLLYSDLSGLNVSIQYILNVLDYLYGKTKYFEIVWENENPNEFYSKNYIESGLYGYFTEAVLRELRFDGANNPYLHYKSKFLENDFVLKNDMFWFENEGDTFYLTQIEDESNSEKGKTYEMYLDNYNGFEGVCYANKDSNLILYDSMERLYLLCLENKKSPKLKKEIKESLEKLMR